ncbi:MAG: VWA domain-containing protein [Chloroflexi bacterium]|nr:VWA domain-containing protein [Chloroflexota bacterium]
MSFLLPLGLLALVALPVIVLLHFLRERLRRIAVPSLLLWASLPRRVDGERSRRLPLTFLLLLHLLVAALLGLALGGPQIAGALSPGARHTAIILDISSSMAADDGGVTRFERGRQRARAILASLAPGDRLTLIAAGSRAQLVASGSSAADIAGALDALRPGDVGMALGDAVTLAEAALDPQLSRRIVLITDGALPPQPPRDVAVPVEWVRIGGDRANRAIIAFATRPWGGRVQVYVRAANYDTVPYAGTLQLLADGRPVAAERIVIEPDGETEVTWTLPSGAEALQAVFDGGDALPRDDAAYVSITRTRPVTALLVSSRPATLRRALAAVPGVAVTVIAPEAYATATERNAADLTVFDGYLPQEWPPGAVLVVAPPPGEGLLRIADTLQRVEGGTPFQQHGAALEGLGLGGVTFGVARRVEVPPWADVQLATGDLPLILRGRMENREIAVWTFDVESGNLPTRLAFPLLVARTVRDLTPPPLPPAVRAGESLVAHPDPRATRLLVRGPGDQSLEAPVAPAVALDSLTEPGLYRVEEQRDGVATLTGAVGVNAGAAIESNLRSQPAPPLRAPATDPGGGASGRQMMDLWPWLALGALLVLALEWAYVLRRR